MLNMRILFTGTKIRTYVPDQVLKQSMPANMRVLRPLLKLDHKTV